MRFSPSLLVWLATAAPLSAATCNRGYVPCEAQGAGSGSPPSIGPDMIGLYADVVNSANGPGSGSRPERRSLNERHGVFARDNDQANLCCMEPSTGIRCLLLKGVKISFCWDRFTTNYYFADGSYGSVTTGEYHLANGDSVNLIMGNYTRSNGEKGNLYGEGNPSPNLSTLPIPTQFTSKGVGTAIPGSELGGAATYTPSVTVSQGTTRAASTIPATTIPASTNSEGVIVPGTTVQETVVPGTTAGPATVTVTAPGKNPTAPPNAGSQTVQLGRSLIAPVVVLACAIML
ncbi:hypothetical protein MGYG_03470 [Nannizzia gypsea CBS 118893]|uniref:Uncharacterized protein n=1 Tax=Arthroderma gypseum (strain ATCC MYA-4604 / CBS 118893) TaxID=535722 RepID=E4US50_ARTGP|nr:hypothetical protein MGYG_03470 [Nannizzia gypsea CBS 118893]EFR00468.1 hypothetical protein MGYG_03470 [Nannizzia gypsea CBS 118893]